MPALSWLGKDKKISFDIRIDEIDIDNNKFASSTLTLDRAKEYQEILDTKTPAEIVGNMRADEFDNLNLQTLPLYIRQIKNEIVELNDTYRKEYFNQLITTKKFFTLQKTFLALKYLQIKILGEYFLGGFN